MGSLILADAETFAHRCERLRFLFPLCARTRNVVCRRLRQIEELCGRPRTFMIDVQFQYEKIRDEIRAEHSLIANRLAWYVTSQSFLVTAFAISRGNSFAWFQWFSTILLPAIGLSTSALIFPSIAGASRTIKLWHGKLTAFFESNPEFKDAFLLERPKWIDTQGLLFPKLMPLLFGGFWTVICIASLFLK